MGGKSTEMEPAEIAGEETVAAPADPPVATVDASTGAGTSRGAVVGRLAAEAKDGGKYISEAHRQEDLGSSGPGEQT